MENKKVIIGIALFLVLVAIGFGIYFGLKPTTSSTTTSAPSSTTPIDLDKLTSSILNRPMENYEDGNKLILCSNIRNQNYKNAINSMLDVANVENNKDIMTYEQINFIIKDNNGKIIMDLKEEDEKRQFISSEISKLKTLMNTLDTKFKDKANYVYLFYLLKDYINQYLGNPKLNLNEEQEKKLIYIFSPTVLTILLSGVLSIYVKNIVKWDEDIISYENNKLKFDTSKLQNYGELNMLKQYLEGKSITDSVKIMYDMYKNKYKLQKNSMVIIIHEFDFKNEDFINTFDSTKECVNTFTEFYSLQFKYADKLLPTYANLNR
jgi:hypothetical protein